MMERKINGKKLKFEEKTGENFVKSSENSTKIPDIFPKDYTTINRQKEGEIAREIQMKEEKRKEFDRNLQLKKEEIGSRKRHDLELKRQDDGKANSQKNIPFTKFSQNIQENEPRENFEEKSTAEIVSFCEKNWEERFHNLRNKVENKIQPQ